MMSAQLALAPGAALNIPSSIESPSLVVDLDRVEENLAEMAQFATSKSIELAPHVKTHRSLEFARLQVEHGASRICVAKLSEAEQFIDAGFGRLVVAYPIAGEEKYSRAARLTPRADIRLSVDSLEAARGLARAHEAVNQRADILLLIDTGFHREGVPPERGAGLAVEISKLDNLRFCGIITHEGHAAGVQTVEGRREASVAAGTTMVELARELRDHGIESSVVSVGSTTTVKHSAVDGISEIRPGIYPFNDFGQVHVGTVGVERCAARVLATVVSHVDPTRAIIDAGSKTLSQDRLSIWGEAKETSHGLVIGHPGWNLHRLSEEHGWLQWQGLREPTPFEIGQKIQILPVHICSVFHETGEAEVIRKGEHFGTWKSSARGQSK